MRTLAALCIMLFLSFAATMSLPSDADIFVTAEDGTIVGIGKTVGGVEFELELLAGFEGFARVLMVTPGGDIHAFDVMVSDGRLFVDLVDLSDIVRVAGFRGGHASVPDASAMPGVAGRPDEIGRGMETAAEAAQGGLGNASEAGHENAGDGPHDGASAGAGNADVAGDDPADPDDAPAPPDDPPRGGVGGGRP